ncbi:hypothetical protein P4S64_17010 [Vibrio sp. M60_M31a]
MSYEKSNRAVVYKGPGKVAVESIPYPELALVQSCVSIGVILKVLTTNHLVAATNIWYVDVQPLKKA